VKKFARQKCRMAHLTGLVYPLFGLAFHLLIEKSNQQIHVGEAVLFTAPQVLNHIAPDHCPIFPPVAQQEGMVSLLTRLNCAVGRLVTGHEERIGSVRELIVNRQDEFIRSRALCARPALVHGAELSPLQKGLSATDKRGCFSCISLCSLRFKIAFCIRTRAGFASLLFAILGPSRSSYKIASCSGCFPPTRR
jgi:hypothetical protein